MCGDSPSQERMAKLCLDPAEAVNGAGAVKIVIDGVVWLKLRLVISSEWLFKEDSL